MRRTLLIGAVLLTTLLGGGLLAGSVRPPAPAPPEPEPVPRFAAEPATLRYSAQLTGAYAAGVVRRTRLTTAPTLTNAPV